MPSIPILRDWTQQYLVWTALSFVCVGDAEAEFLTHTKYIVRITKVHLSHNVRISQLWQTPWNDAYDMPAPRKWCCRTSSDSARNYCMTYGHRIYLLPREHMPPIRLLCMNMVQLVFGNVLNGKRSSNHWFMALENRNVTFLANSAPCRYQIRCNAARSNVMLMSRYQVWCQISRTKSVQRYPWSIRGGPIAAPGYHPITAGIWKCISRCKYIIHF